MKNKPKSILIVCILVSVIPFSSRQVQAQSIFGSNSIDSIFGSLQQVLELVNIDIPGLDFWAKKLLEDPCEVPVIYITTPEPGSCLQRTPVGSIPGQIYESSQSGALGIPNPNEVRTAVDQSMSGMSGTDFADAFDLNAANLTITYANRAEGAIARQFFESTLGIEGQESTKKELDTATEMLSSVTEQTQEAQESVSTQVVVKAMAANQQIFQQTLSSIQAHLIKQEQLQAVGLGLSANISGSLDRAEKYHRAKAATHTSSLLKRAAHTTLF